MEGSAAQEEPVCGAEHRPHDVRSRRLLRVTIVDACQVLAEEEGAQREGGEGEHEEEEDLPPRGGEDAKGHHAVDRTAGA